MLLTVFAIVHEDVLTRNIKLHWALCDTFYLGNLSLDCIYSAINYPNIIFTQAINISTILR